MSATVVALRLSTGSRAPLAVVDRVEAIVDTGLAGDGRRRTSRRQVLFMTEEHLREFGLAPGDVREQVIVRGFDLYSPTAGTRVRIGTAVFALGGPCAPCERMNEVRGGLRAEIDGKRGRFASVAVAGSFGVGDPVVLESASGATQPAS